MRTNLRTVIMMDTLLQDLRYALRSLLRNRGFTMVAVASLALGIGANVAIFTVADAMLFKPLNVPAGARLIRAYYGDHSQFSFADFSDIRQQVKPVVNLAAFAPGSVGIGDGESARAVVAQFITANYFQALGFSLAIGRAFTEEESGAAAGNKIVILSDRLWRSRFNGATDVAGKTLTINGARYEIIGVAPAAYRGTMAGQDPELVFPMSEAPALLGTNLTERTVGGSLYTVGQLAGKTTIDQAKASLAQAAASLAHNYPDIHQRLTISADRARGVPAEVWPALAVAGGGLQMLVALVILIACSNVVNVVLARATTRRRELAVRAALGANRRRLAQQLFTESALVAVAATGVGVLLSAWVVTLGFRMLPPEFPLAAPDLSMNVRVVGYAAAIAFVTMLICGLWPALRTSRAALAPALRESHGGNDPRQSRLRNGLLVAQVSMCTVLLVGSGLFLRSLLSASDIRPGFDVNRVLDIPVDLRQLNLDETRGRLFISSLRDRLERLNGVEAVTAARLVPLSFDNMGMSFNIEGRLPVAGAEMPEAGFNIVDADYFKTLGIELLRGRAITVEDSRTAPFVAVVNETMARAYWPDGNAIGQRFGANIWGTPATVVGVVRDSKYTTLGEDAKPFMYLPFAQHYSTQMVVQVRTAGSPAALQAAARSALLQEAPNAVTAHMQPLAVDVRVALLPARVGAAMLGVFGLLALVLAMGGVFGVVSFTVAQRTREIGIRTALGGTASDIVRFVMSGSMRNVGVGLGLGLVLAMGVGQFLSSFLYGVSALDPVTFIAVPLGFAVVAAGASAVPVRRAVRVDPIIALRAE